MILIAFGCTEEKLLHTIFGCKARGSESDKPFDHKSGEGWVRAHKGHYHDAIHVKKNTVFAFIADDFGGVTKASDNSLRYLAKQASVGPRDGTRYGESSTTDFYCHHTIAVSLAVVISVAKAIEKGVGARTRKHVASTQRATPPSPP